MKNKINAFIALMMMTVTPTMQAHAETLTIQSAINELNYALTVQLDAKDQVGRAAAIAHYAEQVKELNKQGISSDQIVTAIKAQLPDAQAAKDIDSLVQIAKEKKLTSPEADKMVVEYLKTAHTAGASWSDHEANCLFGSLALGILVAAIVWGSTAG